MAIRRLNHTKRIDLGSNNVRVSLGSVDRRGLQTFDVELALPQDLPADSRVVLEAYRASPPVRMRFDLGTVGALTVPQVSERTLTEFSGDSLPPLFRLKVVGVGEREGRLLADARQVRPLDLEKQGGAREGILHVHHKNLDGLVWELDVENSGYEPTLWIDKDSDPAGELARDPRFVALVYPEVLRGVLMHLLVEEDGASFDDESGWGQKWIAFASSLPGMNGDAVPATTSDDDERRKWIDRAVRAFATKVGVRDLINPAVDEGL